MERILAEEVTRRAERTLLEIDSHRDLFSLLDWGLFSPLTSDSVFDQVFNSAVESLDLESSTLLRFSLLQSLLAIEGHITQPSECNQLFKSLLSATRSSFLSNSKEFGPVGTDEFNARIRSSCSEILPQAQQKACLLLGPAETHHFMYALSTLSIASKVLHFPKKDNLMKISYNSNIGGFWKITSYSDLSSMETTSGSPMAEVPLHVALNYHLLHCIFQFRSILRFCPDWIEVCLEMDNVRCDVIPLDMSFALVYATIPADFRNERHFPSKIVLTIGPQNGCVVHSVSLARSSQNPVTDIGKGNNYEVTFEPPQKVGLKAAVSTTYTDKIKNWGFEQSIVEDKDAEIDWTLYDSATGKAVFNSGVPKFSALGPKTWSIDRYSKASRAFTKKGGVVFAGDEYGSPITWRLNRDLEGQTLKWAVKGSVWLTYWPNTHRTRYSETKRHDFCQELDLTLVDPSGPAPT